MRICRQPLTKRPLNRLDSYIFYNRLRNVDAFICQFHKGYTDNQQLCFFCKIKPSDPTAADPCE